MNVLKKALENSDELLLVGGVYDGVSAHVIEACGYNAVWVSGFCVSSSKFIPDNNMLTAPEMIDRVHDICDATNLPAIIDCDEGYGTQMSTERFCKKLYAAGASCICIEDNRYPKVNSFFGDSNDSSMLELPELYCNKVKAIRDIFSDRLVMCRTESMIRGESISQAMDRAELYIEAGADIIVVHSRSHTTDEFADIIGQWRFTTPLAVIPTLSECHVDDFSRLGYRMVIYANQALRSAIGSMSQVMTKIREGKNLKTISDAIVSMEDIASSIDKHTHHR